MLQHDSVVWLLLRTRGQTIADVFKAEVFERRVAEYMMRQHVAGRLHAAAEVAFLFEEVLLATLLKDRLNLLQAGSLLGASDSRAELLDLRSPLYEAQLLLEHGHQRQLEMLHLRARLQLLIFGSVPLEVSPLFVVPRKQAQHLAFPFVDVCDLLGQLDHVV